MSLLGKIEGGGKGRKKENRNANVVREVQDEMIRRAEADDELQFLKEAKNYRATRDRAQTLFNEILAERGDNFSRNERMQLFEMVTQPINEYGPLESLMRDDRIDEIRVLGWDQVWAAAPLRKVATTFDDHQHLLRVLDRIMTQFGKTLNASNPSIHFKTPDGSRITAMIPPLSPGGPVLTIRKHNYGSYLNTEDLIRFGTIHQEAMEFLSKSLKHGFGLNVLITGESSTGMTTLMVVLGNLIPNDEFIVVIDDDVEVGGLKQEQVVHLQTQIGMEEIDKTQLIQHAATMLARRILVGDLDGKEINEVIRSWTPWLATMRAHSVENALNKLETVSRLVRGDDPLIPFRIAEAVDLIVHMERLRSGSRRVGRISEVRYEEGGLVVHDIYALKIINQRLEARLQFVNRPIGEQFADDRIQVVFDNHFE